MERTAEDIRLFARLGFLIYADGYTAKIAGMKPGKDQLGNSVWDFVLDPSDELIKRYNLKPKNNSMVYTCQLPYNFCIQLNPDPAWNRWFYLKTYDGKTNPEIEKLDISKSVVEISRLNSINTDLKLRLEVANEKLKAMELNIPKYLEKNFKPLMEQFAPILEKVAKKND